MKDIDEIRRDNLRFLEQECGGLAVAAAKVGMSPAQFANLRDGAKDSKTGKPRGMRKETARRIETSFDKAKGWLDIDHKFDISEASITAPNRGLIAKSDPYGEHTITEKKSPAYGNVERVAMGRRDIPVISYVQAGMMTEAIDPFSLGEGFETITVDFPCSEQTFALRIKGKSMLPKFEEDDVVVVDPLESAIPGSFVVAKNSDDEATFKKYRAIGVDEHGNAVFELVPLNDDFATLHSERDHLHIVGVAIEHRKKLLK